MSNQLDEMLYFDIKQVDALPYLSRFEKILHQKSLMYEFVIKIDLTTHVQS